MPIFVEDGATVDGNYYLKMQKKHLYVIRRLCGGQKFTVQQDGTCCHTTNSVTSYLNDNVLNYMREENWPNSCDLNPLDYAIWDMMENMVYKNVMRYGDIKGLSTAISDAWNRQTKKFINNSIDQWWMRLGGHIEHLI